MPKSRKSFTIIELLIVITIVGIIVAILLVVYGQEKERAKIAKNSSFSSQIYHALGADIIGSWGFDEGSGNSALDSSKMGNNGTLENGSHKPTWRCAYADKNYTPFGTGCSLEFEGSNSYIEIPDSLSLNPTTITMEAWVYPTDYKNNAAIIYKWSSERQYALQFSGNGGRIEGYVYISGNHYCTTPEDKAIPLNKWSHIVHTYNGVTGTVYINSEKACTYSYSGSIASGSGTLLIGKGSGFFKGFIDEVRIYNGSLTQAQIKKLYVEGIQKRNLNLCQK